MICGTELAAGASILLTSCSHVFHYSCVVNVIRKKWSGKRIQVCSLKNQIPFIFFLPSLLEFF